jgi:hypothetical protein
MASSFWRTANELSQRHYYSELPLFVKLGGAISDGKFQIPETKKDSGSDQPTEPFVGDDRIALYVPWSQEERYFA